MQAKLFSRVSEGASRQHALPRLQCPVANCGKKEDLYTSKTARVNYDSTTLVYRILCTIDVLPTVEYIREKPMLPMPGHACHVIKEDNPLSKKREAHAIHVPR